MGMKKPITILCIILVWIVSIWALTFGSFSSLETIVAVIIFIFVNVMMFEIGFKKEVSK